MPMLSWNEIEKVSQQFGIEAPLIKTVIEVETNGKAFLPSGKPVILFEGHIFYKLLNKTGKYNLPKLIMSYPTIIYKKWTKKYYQGGSQEWQRLECARNIDKDIANQSASWGLFQIMGFNYNKCGYDNVEDFVNAMCNSETEQLKAFMKFIQNDKMFEHLSKQNWKSFAYLYNGSAYAENKYDTKLARAYANNITLYKSYMENIA